MAQQDAVMRRVRAIRNVATAPWRWWFNTTPPAASVVEDPEIPRSLIPTVAPGPRRASPSAYRVTHVQFVNDDVIQYPSGRGRFDSTPRPYRRAANAAYLINSKFSTPEASVEDQEIGKSLLPRHAPGARRTARTAYDIGPAMVPPTTTTEVEIERNLIPDRAPGARRTSPNAYAIRSTFVPPDVVTGEAEIRRSIMPERAYGPRRASGTAYRIDSKFVNPDGAQYPASRGRIDSHPRPRRRAANWAYWWIRQMMVPDVVPANTGKPCCITIELQRRSITIDAERRSIQITSDCDC